MPWFLWISLSGMAVGAVALGLTGCEAECEDKLDCDPHTTATMTTTTGTAMGGAGGSGQTGGAGGMGASSGGGR